eukprot:2326706-Rhodomonas_salina.1
MSGADLGPDASRRPLVKSDVKAGTVKLWEAAGCAPGGTRCVACAALATPTQQHNHTRTQQTPQSQSNTRKMHCGPCALSRASACARSAVSASGEPIFVPNPQAASEDDGVLLSVVLDGSTDKSFLLGLDAATMQEVFRAQLPHHCPAGFHGEWFGDRADAN